MAAASLAGAASAAAPVGEVEDPSSVMFITQGLDWKSLVIVLLTVIIFVETLLLVIMTGILVFKKFSAEKAIELRNAQERYEQARRIEEEEPALRAARNEEYPPPPVPMAGPNERIRKKLWTAPSGQCFHNADCSTLAVARQRGTARVYRPCNVCFP